MSWDFFRGPYGDPDEERDEKPRRPAPGKVTLTSRLRPVQRRSASARPGAIDGHGFLAQAVQRKAERAEAEDPFALHLTSRPLDDSAAVHAAAARGLAGPAQPLPHLEEIQRAFGRHDVTHVKAHVGGVAAEASAAIGAEAFATGDQVAFQSAPGLHTTAHEAAHVVQQAGGVQLKGGVGEEGDVYERHADAVADKVVAGESAERLLDQFAAAARSPAPPNSVQRKGGKGNPPRPDSSPVEVADHLSWTLDELDRAIKQRDYHAANAAMVSTLEVLPRVDALLRPGPARSAADQTAIEELRRLRRMFEVLAPKAPGGGAPSDDERRSWLARTPVSLVPPPARSTPRPNEPAPPAAPPPSSTARAPITGVPVRSDDADDRVHDEYLAAHWDRIRDSAGDYFAGQDLPLGSPRLAWAADGARRAQQIVSAIFPTLHVSGQLEALVAPRSLDTALRLGRAVMVRPGEGDGDPTWNPSVGIAIARLLRDRLAESTMRMGPRYVTAYDLRGGAVSAVDLARSDAMDGVAASLLTQELVRVMGPLPRPARSAGANVPRKWRWLGERDPGLWNWIEVTDPPDATADDVALLLPADVPPLVESDGRFFRMPEDWARMQPGVGELAPTSATSVTGTELAASPFALDAAIVQARDAPKVNPKGFDLEAISAACAGHIGQVVALLGPQYADRIVPAYTVLGAAKVASGKQQRDLPRVLASQEALLVEVVQEIETFHSVSYARGRTRGNAAVESVYLEFALAAGNSHLYHLGRRHLDQARAKAATVGRRVAEEALIASSAGASKLDAVGGAGVDDAKARQRDRFDRLDADAPDPGSMEVDASIDAFVLQTQSLEQQLDTMMGALFATNERLASPLAMRVVADAEQLGSAVSDVRGRAAAVRTWLVEKLATTHSAPARRELLERAQRALGERITSTQVMGLSHRVVAMLERVDDADRRIQIINTALMAMGIALVAGGAGIAVQAALTTPKIAAATNAGVMTAGRVGVAAAGMVAETVVGAWLQTELLGDKPGEALAENALGWLMTVAALRGFQKVTERFGPFTAENLALWQQLGGAGAKVALRTTHVTLEMALGAGAGYAAQRIVRSPVQPTEDEALEWAMQGASIVASRWIMTSLMASRARLQEARGRVPADAAARIDATLKDIDSLHARAAGVADRPIDQPEILHLFGEHQRLVGAEAAVAGTKADGADGPSAGREPSEAKTRADGERGGAYAETVLTLAGLREVAPGQWQGSEAAVRRLVANKRALPLVEESGADGAAQWTATSGGKKHTVKIGGDELPSRTRHDRDPFSEEGRRENQKALAAGEPGYNAVVGYVDTEKGGIALLQRLMRGDATALKEIGYESSGRFDPSSREWGLGQVGRKYVVVAGEHAAVDWSAVAGVTPVGHSHPRDAERIGVHDGKRLDVRHVVAVPGDDALLVFSSPSDISLLARRKVARHTIVLPYEHLGGTEIGLASASPSGRSHVELVLENAAELGQGPGGATRYRARATMKAGEEVIWQGTIDAVYPPGKQPSLEFDASVQASPTAGSRPNPGEKTRSGSRVDGDGGDALTNYLGDSPETRGVQVVDPVGKEPHQSRLPVAKEVDPAVPPETASSGFWADENARGNTLWFSDNKKVNEVTGYKPIKFRDGYPILDAYAWETVYLERMVGSDADFSPADIELARRHGQLKRNGEPNQQWAKDYRKANMLTWHHHQDGARMQLMPFDLHSNIPHAGGASAARGDAP